MFVILTLLQQVSKFSTSAHGRHNTAPDGIMYYLVLIVAAAIVAAVFYWAIKYLFWPGEKSEDHIKYKILEN